MKKQNWTVRLGTLAGGTAMLLTVPQVYAADGNPFALSGGDGATIMVAEAGGQKGISVLEGKCGAGKCGAQRVRQMMDKNADGRIDRDEYVSWSSSVANREFDEISKGSAAVGADDVFEHYRSLEFHNQG